MAQNEVEYTQTKWSMNLQVGLTPVTSTNSKTLNCFQSQLGIEYQVASNIYIGIFGQVLKYYQNLDISNIDNKIIDMNSIEYNTLGLNLGYKKRFDRFIFYPKIDLGYNFLLAKSLDFPTDKKEFLDYRYFSITPKVNIGYFVSEGLCLGLYGGYNRQILAFKGKIIDEFNPNALCFGLNAGIELK